MSVLVDDSRGIWAEEKERIQSPSSQCRAPDEKVPTSDVHDVTPKADNARCGSSARQTSASVLVSSTLDRPGVATRKL